MSFEKSKKKLSLVKKYKTTGLATKNETSETTIVKGM